MDRREVIISDFRKWAREKERLAEECTPDKWELVDYQTAVAGGTMLMASEETLPQPVTVDPGIAGWYRVYVCMADFGGGMAANHIDLRLAGDPCSRSVRAGDTRPYADWNCDEQVEEAFWRCADMTGKTVTISKAVGSPPHTSNILWLRFVPMTEAEAEAQARLSADWSRKTMLAHMDMDFHMCDDARAPREFCKQIWALAESDVGVLCQEVTNDLIDWENLPEDGYTPRKSGARLRMDYCRRLYMMRREVYPEEAAFAHSLGMRLFASLRMQLSNFGFPMAQPLFEVPFVSAHPELRCAARDGTPCEFLSYAYRETQDYVIGALLDAAQYGFDGVHLIFIRGQQALFEKPMEERYIRKYGDKVPFNRLPADDPRLMDIRADVMSEFLGRLRSALDGFSRKAGRERIQIYLTAYFSAEDSLRDGLDIERFAREGLIDGVIQSNMSVWEETDGLLAEDGLVDLEKYAEKARTGYVVRRSYANNVPATVAGLPGYRAIADKYPIALYSDMPWESTMPPEDFMRAARRLYEAGAVNLALWDCCPTRAQCLSEWAADARMGRKEEVMAASLEPSAYRRVIKVLSYNGQDKRYYHPSWRG